MIVRTLAVSNTTHGQRFTDEIYWFPYVFSQMTNLTTGKTTFLNDVHKSHKCIYIRQYHAARPYVMVSKIPTFDPSKLPYWHIYEKEKTATTIKIGGTMAGEFTAGLSGGQRKLLFFEIVTQRVKQQSNLLICLDEPFAGVTDDFVPHIVERLTELRQHHQILLHTLPPQYASVDLARR